MTSPLPLPDWVPWWVHLVLILAALLFGLLFLLMPFSVFGVKARLEGIEARLDEIQGEIRSLALRLPEPGLDDDPYAQRREDRPQQRDDRPFVQHREDRAAEPYRRPPIPPAPIEREPGRADPRIVRPPPGRNEPRLY